MDAAAALERAGRAAVPVGVRAVSRPPHTQVLPAPGTSPRNHISVSGNILFDQKRLVRVRKHYRYRYPIQTAILLILRVVFT